jgi:hypothetical protein
MKLSTALFLVTAFLLIIIGVYYIALPVKPLFAFVAEQSFDSPSNVKLIMYHVRTLQKIVGVSVGLGNYAFYRLHLHYSNRPYNFQCRNFKTPGAFAGYPSPRRACCGRNQRKRMGLRLKNFRVNPYQGHRLISRELVQRKRLCWEVLI